MIKQEQIQFLIEEMTREIIIYLMQDFGYDMDKALKFSIIQILSNALIIHKADSIIKAPAMYIVS